LGGKLVTNFRRVLAIVVAVGLTSVFAISGISGAAPAGPDEGVTDKSVKIGFIYPKTGVASSSSGTAGDGCKARVGRENAKGGVNGRKIDVVYFDDASSAANLTGAQSLVQSDKVFAVVNSSPYAFLAWRWLHDNGVALVDGGYAGGGYTSLPGNEQIISGFGNGSGAGVSDVWARIMKAKGAKKAAVIGFGISSSSKQQAQKYEDTALPSQGIDAAYINTSVDFGTTDVNPVVLGMKGAGVDGAFYIMTANTNLAIAQGLAQNGVPMKAQVMATGYGQALLDQPVAKTIGSDVIFTQHFAPIELKTKATKQLVSDLKKYTDYSGVPDFGIYTGYIDCELLILGLKAQGKNLDRATFADGIRKMGRFNPAGLWCQPLDFSLATYSDVPETDCQFATSIKDGKFVVVKPKGSSNGAFSGKRLATDSAAATTTTAPA
jgi:branched-chain amino acid transport system substrate-binding protein